MADRNPDGGKRLSEEAFLRAVLAGYPDRVAKRREPGSPRVVLASGHGAVLARESGVRSGEFLVAVEVRAGQRGDASEARIGVASLVRREWLSPTGTRTIHQLDPQLGVVRAFARDMYDELTLAERQVEPDAAEAARLLADAKLSRGLTDEEQRLIRRLRFAGFEVDVHALVRAAAVGCRALADVDLARRVSPDHARQLDRLAPDRLALPSGRSARLEYRDDGTVRAAAKLQELFGMAETPRIGPRAEPVSLELLAPNGRPVQVTRDLRSFWNTTYSAVRRELRGRYPKPPWPEDPWTATPTARTKKREGSRP